MDECENKGCSLCRSISGDDSSDELVRGDDHPKVTDIRNRELGLFFLVLIIMSIVVFAILFIYFRVNDSGEQDSSTPVAMIYESH